MREEAFHTFVKEEGIHLYPQIGYKVMFAVWKDWPHAYDGIPGDDETRPRELSQWLGEVVDIKLRGLNRIYRVRRDFDGKYQEVLKHEVVQSWKSMKKQIG